MTRKKAALRMARARLTYSSKKGLLTQPHEAGEAGLTGLDDLLRRLPAAEALAAN